MDSSNLFPYFLQCPHVPPYTLVLADDLCSDELEQRASNNDINYDSKTRQTTVWSSIQNILFSQQSESSLSSDVAWACFEDVTVFSVKPNQMFGSISQPAIRVFSFEWRHSDLLRRRHLDSWAPRPDPREDSGRCFIRTVVPKPPTSRGC